MKKRFSSFSLSLAGLSGLIGFILLCTSAFAQSDAIASSSGPFSSTPDSDWASAWIDFLFRGINLPASLASYGARLAPLTEGLRQAFGLYSLGMLILAGLMLFYHLAAMVAETAHYGVAFGRRTNPIWAPIRLIFALGLLVPVSGGLSSGQYLVIKIADLGSSMASNAWRTIASSMGGSLSGVVTPHYPNISQIVTASLEMEMCRLTYQQFIPAQQNDVFFRNVGTINDIVKMPADRFNVETWRYTNMLSANVALCGEYRFAGFRRHRLLPASDADDMAKLADDLNNYGYAQANDLILQTRGLANRTAPNFFGNTLVIGTDIHSDLASLKTVIGNSLDNHLQPITAAMPRYANHALAQSVQGGWVAAASLMPQIIGLQQSYGELVNHALPTVQEPILAHPVIMQQAFTETLNTQFWARPLETEDAHKLAVFYTQASRISSLIHTWLYSSQLGDSDFIPPDSFDLRDHINSATAPDAAGTMFARAIDNAALANGVWGVEGVDNGYPFALPANLVQNPFGLLAEFGRRQLALGDYLFDLTGSVGSLSNVSGSSLLTNAAGFLFLFGGCLVLFVVPFLGFFRFIMAVAIWVVSLFEAVIAMPVVALAHLTPGGEGLSGGTARQAYVLWLGLALRPLLTLFGLVCGWVVFALILSLVATALTPFAHMSTTKNSGLLIVTNIGLVLLFDILAYMAANAAFKGIYLLPDQSMRWISRFAMTDSETLAPAPVVAPPSIGSASSFATSSSLSTPQLTHQSLSSSTNYRDSAAQGKTGATTAKASAKGHGLKAALFPNHGDKNQTGTTQGQAPVITTTSERNIVTPYDKKPAPPLIDKKKDASASTPITPKEDNKKPDDDGAPPDEDTPKE